MDAVIDLGIDFGTTNTVVAAVEHGNYPVLSFSDSDGNLHVHLPSLTAWTGGRLVHGYQAREAMAAGAPGIRSLKRLLSSPTATVSSTVRMGSRLFPIMEVLTDYLSFVVDEVRQTTGVHHLRAVIGVPAHAHTGQRFMTLEAFREAGVEVMGIVNEPSAAGLEYALRQARTLNSRRTQVLIFDLGGGTFDASLVDMAGTHGRVIDSVGSNDLGGDDFDHVLVDLVRPMLHHPAPPEPVLVEACRLAKEAIRPQSRNVMVDLPDEAVRIPVRDFESSCRGLIDKALDVMEPLTHELTEDQSHSELAGIHLVGGGSCLPFVARRVREDFGRRVHRSAQPTAATAVGLAMAADPSSPYSIRDRLSRGFGVFRESQDGAKVSFDVLLDQSTPIHHPVVIRRHYQARHNLGVYRFVECQQTHGGAPVGDMTPFATIIVPLDAQMQSGERPLDPTDVHIVGDCHWVEEEYTVAPTGIVQVTITDLDTRWSVTTFMGADRPNVSSL